MRHMKMQSGSARETNDQFFCPKMKLVLKCSSMGIQFHFDKFFLPLFKYTTADLRELILRSHTVMLHTRLID